MYQVSVTYQIPGLKSHTMLRDYILIQLEEASLDKVLQAVLAHKPFNNVENDDSISDDGLETPFMRARNFLIRNLKQQYQAFHDVVSIGADHRLQALHNVTFYVTANTIANVFRSAENDDWQFQELPRPSQDGLQWDEVLTEDPCDEDDDAPSYRPAKRPFAKPKRPTKKFAYSSEDAFLEFAVQKLPENVAFTRV